MEEFSISHQDCGITRDLIEENETRINDSLRIESRGRSC